MAYYPPEGREHYKGPSALPSHLLMRARLHALFLSETCLSAAKSSHAFVPLVDDSGKAQKGKRRAPHFSSRFKFDFALHFSLKILYFCLPAAPHPTQILLQCARKSSAVRGSRRRSLVMIAPARASCWFPCIRPAFATLLHDMFLILFVFVAEYSCFNFIISYSHGNATDIMGKCAPRALPSVSTQMPPGNAHYLAPTKLIFTHSFCPQVPWSAASSTSPTLSPSMSSSMIT